MSTSVLTFAASEELRELPMPPWLFGVVAGVVFLLALGFLWSFRNTAAKHDPANIVHHGGDSTDVSHHASGGHH
ncbi:MAG: hypothetical protein LWW86_05865 [Micrococcales bacterium]|nr:hypothetical protein [Micrococcales bacterium]